MYRHYLKCVHNETTSDHHALEENGRLQNGCSIPRSIEQSPKKLVLHFDARNTIFVADHFSRISVEQALNTYIAGVVWGIDRDNGQWECISETPTLCTPVPGAVSMYKLMERDLVRVPSDRAQLRQALGDFTQTPSGAKFVSYFTHHLALLKWPDAKADAVFTVTGQDGCPYHYLLPSFLHLIAHLHDTGADFCVIIRTFGRDAPHILQAIQRFLHGDHPDFPTARDVPVREEVEKLVRTPEGEYRYHFTQQDGTHSELHSQRDIYERWNATCGVLGVVDDFVHWQKNNYHFSAAKPLWFDPSDSRNQHIMFDDNIRVDDEDNILNLCRLCPSKEVCSAEDIAYEHSLTPDQARLFEDVFFVQADLLKSTSNLDYFIEQTSQCVANLKKLRASNKTLLPL